VAVKHVLELTFSPALVNQPEVSKMIRAHDVVVSMKEAAIIRGEGTLSLDLMGEEPEVEAAENFLRKAGVQVELKARGEMTKPLPDVPRKTFAPVDGPVISRKLWLTIDLPLIQRPVMWEVSRRFNVEFDIRQGSIGEDVGIIGLVLRGPEDEVEAACAFLESIDVEVEPIESSAV
jgi:ABC-type methionine transport system ATPase subunit